MGGGPFQSYSPYKSATNLPNEFLGFSSYLPGSFSLSSKTLSVDEPSELPPSEEPPPYLAKPLSQTELENVQDYEDLLRRFQIRIEEEGLNKYLAL
jgi:hypothetical protein